MEKRPVAYQLYSSRDKAAADLRSTLTALKEMGYDGIEFAGLYGHDPHDVRKMLDEIGLAAVSHHVPLIRMEEDPYGVIAEQQILGCSYMAVPYLDDQHRPGAPGFAHALCVISRMARLLEGSGITLLYHNHDFEFVNLSGMYGMDFLYQAFPASQLQCELDLCWVKYAGVDPAAYIRKYAGRCPVLHLKDFVGVKKEGGADPYALIGMDEGAEKKDVPFTFKPLGFGCQNVKDLLETGIEAGCSWFIVEQDNHTERDDLEDAAMSISTLKALGLC